jgi:hypothetical protein
MDKPAARGDTMRHLLGWRGRGRGRVE